MPYDASVAPYAGAWIETRALAACLTTRASRPTRARGLKQSWAGAKLSGVVAPYAGAWIETKLTVPSVKLAKVAPYAGAWIETSSFTRGGMVCSRALRGRVD